jgi:hypothetical protein
MRAGDIPFILREYGPGSLTSGRYYQVDGDCDENTTKLRGCPNGQIHEFRFTSAFHLGTIPYHRFQGGQVVGAKLESFAPVYEHKWMSSTHVAHSSMSWNHTNSPPCNSFVRAPVARCCSSGETNVDFHYNLEDKVGGEPIISSAESHPWSDLAGRSDDRPFATWGIYASRKRLACLESSSL